MLRGSGDFFFQTKPPAKPTDDGGSAAYAREELTAELASFLASYRLRIGFDLSQHAAYMSSWAKALKEGGAKELMKVLSEARMAADLIVPEPGGELEL